MRTDKQIDALYWRAIRRPLSPGWVTDTRKRDADLAAAICEIRHVLAAKTDAAAGRYLARKQWGEPVACAAALRRAARIPKDEPAKKVTRKR